MIKIHRSLWWLATILGLPLALFCLGEVKNFLVVPNAVLSAAPVRGGDAKFFEITKFEHIVRKND